MLLDDLKFTCTERLDTGIMNNVDLNYFPFLRLIAVIYIRGRGHKLDLTTVVLEKTMLWTVEHDGIYTTAEVYGGVVYGRYLSGDGKKKEPH